MFCTVTNITNLSLVYLTRLYRRSSYYILYRAYVKNVFILALKPSNLSTYPTISNTPILFLSFLLAYCDGWRCENTSAVMNWRGQNLRTRAMRELHSHTGKKESLRWASASIRLVIIGAIFVIDFLWLKCVCPRYFHPVILLVEKSYLFSHRTPQLNEHNNLITNVPPILPTPYQNEAMTGTHTQNPAYSRITLALMEDTGWYRANYHMAQPLKWGRHLGCSFAMSSCKDYMDAQTRKWVDLWGR